MFQKAVFINSEKKNKTKTNLTTEQMDDAGCH